MTKRHSLPSIGFAAAETLAHRLPVFWQSILLPSPKGNAELTNMVVEKQMAFAEGLFAMQMELFKLAVRPWWDARLPHQAVNDLAYAVTAPAARRVKANARRLRRQ